MKNYYCLGTSDSTTENAIDILKRRIDEKKYPLYKKTPFLNDIKKDDEVVFYVAGRKNKSQNFIAFSVIQSVEIPNETLIDPDKNKYVLEKYLLFENITLLKIKSVKEQKTEEKNAKDEIIHQGISKRYFSKTFTVADDTEIKGAELKDGLLRISLERIIPESKKPRTIEIN